MTRFFIPSKSFLTRKREKMTLYDACSVVEGFDGQEHSEEETLRAWQYLIDTGYCWTLQGCYGRTASRLIEAGYCTAKGNQNENI